MQKRSLILFSALLFCCVFFFYGVHVQGLGFIFDDREQILSENENLGLPELQQIFTSPHFSNLIYYRPLSRLLSRVQLSLCGKEPRCFHLVNCFLAALSAVLLFLILCGHFPAANRWYCFLAALAAALHPVTSSCVFMISGQESLLALLFILLSFYSFSSNRLCLSALTLYAAMLSRENAAVLPLLLTMMVFLTPEGSGSQQPGRWRKTAFIWLATIACLVQRGLVLESAAAGRGFQALDKPALSYLYLLQSILMPPFSLVYEPSEAVWLDAGKSAAVILTVCGFIWTARRQSSQRDKISIWLFWLVVMFAPTANFIVQQTMYDERHCLIALIAVPGLILAAGGRWFESLSKKVILAFTVLLILLAGITHHRAQFFADDFKFASQWLKSNPEAGEAYAIMAALFWEKGNPNKALELFEQSLRLQPGMASSHDNIGCLLSDRNELEKAADHFRQAVALDPQNYYYRFNLATNLLSRGMYIESYINMQLVRGHDSLPDNVGKMADFSIAQAFAGFFYGKTD